MGDILMLLSCQFLSDVNNVNSFEYLGNVWEMTEGDAQTIYFRLVDLSKNKSSSPPGLRYVPNASSTLSVVLENINDTTKITRSATQVYSTSDPSIWSVALLATDTLVGTVTMRLTLTEPLGGGSTRVTRGTILGALRVRTQ